LVYTALVLLYVLLLHPVLFLYVLLLKTSLHCFFTRNFFFQFHLPSCILPELDFNTPVFGVLMIAVGG
jgi:hypothetical protein